MKLLHKGGEKGDRPHLPERPATNLRSVPGFAQMGPVPFFQAEEHLMLEFDEGDEALRPQLQDRPGAEVRRRHEEPPPLAKLGGRTWGRQKEAVEAAVTDLAADMIEIQAARACRRASRFPPTPSGSRSSMPRSPTTKPPTN